MNSSKKTKILKKLKEIRKEKKLTSKDMAEKLGKRVIWARALPGKYSPKTAASIIKESLIPLLET